MKTLTAPTEEFVRTERANLAADATPGTDKTLVLTNNTGLADGDFVVVGREGSETAELCRINNAVTLGTDIRVATLRRSHGADEPITKYTYDKRKFYGSTTEGGSYTQLTGDGSPVDISVNDPQGTSLEYSGDTYTYFKATYYNSQTAVETNIIDSDAVQGDQTSRYTTLHKIRVQAGLTKNPYITDDTLETYRKRAENEVNSYIYARYVLPLVNTESTVEIPFIIENATTLLAAGYMDYQEFGAEGEGVKWLGEARGLLKAIQDGRQRLIDSTGSEFPEKTLMQGINSYPDQVDNRNGPARVFTMKQRF